VKLNLRTAAVCILAVSVVTPAFAQSAGDNYKTKCQACHLADGSGNQGMKIPAFKSPETVKATDAALFAAIKNGAGTGAIKMPAYTGKLTDDQIKALVAFVRTLQK
jgi:mono/diheme cytochrome c family protein